MKRNVMQLEHSKCHLLFPYVFSFKVVYDNLPTNRDIDVCKSRNGLEGRSDDCSVELVTRMRDQPVNRADTLADHRVL